MTEPIRVLQVVGGMNAGGIESFLMSVYRAIDRDCVQFDFLESEEEPCFYDDEIRELGGTIYKMRQPRRQLPETTRKLRDFYTSHDYDIAHFHFGHMGTLLSMKIAKQCSVETRVIHAHCANSRLSTAHTFMHAVNKVRAPSFYTDACACSRDAAEYFGFDVGREGGWRYVPNGIDIPRFAFSNNSRASAREELGFDEGDLCVGMAGRFSPPKNYFFGLEVFAGLTKTCPEARLLIVSGGGDLESDIRARIDELGLGRRITVLKNRRDMDRLYCAMDTFFFPSIYEGLGIVLVEAQTSGLPCVISDAIPTEAITCPSTRVVPLSDDIDIWVEALREALALGRNSDGPVQAAAAGFDIRQVAAGLADFYLSKNR